jgi:hypothetical protein
MNMKNKLIRVISTFPVPPILEPIIPPLNPTHQHPIALMLLLPAPINNLKPRPQPLPRINPNPQSLPIRLLPKQIIAILVEEGNFGWGEGEKAVGVEVGLEGAGDVKALGVGYGGEDELGEVTEDFVLGKVPYLFH